MNKRLFVALDLPEAADIVTPEQFQPEHPPRKADGSIAVWEGCQTFSGSWGYHRDEATWKSDKQCVEMLIRHVARGGNLIMNVGPTARGYFDHRAMARLDAFAKWMDRNSRSIYGCTMAEPEFTAPADCRFTQSADGKRLYLHLFAYPFAHILLPGMAGKVDYAQFLHDGSEVLFTEGKMEHFGEGLPECEGLLVLNLPPVKPDCLVPVIEMYLK